MDSVSKVILASLPLCRAGNDESPKGEALWLSELPALPSPPPPHPAFSQLYSKLLSPTKASKDPEKKSPRAGLHCEFKVLAPVSQERWALTCHLLLGLSSFRCRSEG